MSDIVLAAHDIRKTFTEGRETVEVLRGASLELRAGEVVALEGPSGSGKSTMLCILGCVLTATSGTLAVGGETVTSRTDLARLRRERLGFVFQQFNLIPALSALENVEYALNLKGVDGRSAAEQATALIERVGLADRARFLPRDLSGGQKQRVAIARALAASPSLVLADEPTANLDASVADSVLDLFTELARKEQRSLLIVTHDPKVRRVADRVVRIEDGKLAA